ncbi:MAG: glycosyltransferase family 2 protein [Bacteriovoracia bacterium]
MKVSVVVPVFNQIHYTKIFVESFLADDQRPECELIIIDNNSSDGTFEYLEALKEKYSWVEIIHNETNVGVAPAWNQGIRASKGDYIAILNNDIQVSKGWLHNLIWALDHHHLALVSPFAEVGPRIDYDFQKRAKAFSLNNRFQVWDEYDFCAVLMPRSTFEKIGFFDENFQVGGYEDTDYCYRLNKENLGYGVSGASFIHHFGSQTLGAFKKAGDKHVPHNHSYFVSKWRRDPRSDTLHLSSKIKRSWRKFKLLFDRM